MGQGNNAVQPKKPDNSELWSWILIAVMFAVVWPVGLILLLSKLSDGSNREKIRRRAQQAATAAHNEQQTRQGTAARTKDAPADQTGETSYTRRMQEKIRQEKAARETTAQKLTRTPQFSAKGANTMRIIGIVLSVVGAIALFRAAWDNYFFLTDGYWMWFLEELFYPMGLTAGGLGLLAGGVGMKRRLRRFGKYMAIAGDRQTVSITMLASASDVSVRRVEKDLELMLQKGLWGENAYLDLGRGLLVRSAEAAKEFDRAQEKKAAPQEAEKGFCGQLREIRRVNDRIADPIISGKIDRLEELAGKIFRIVDQEPAKKAKAATFLNYYLPTTQKLLDSYADFEESGVSGENVSQAKRRIADTMDKIVEGFERQLDQLYQSDAMDVDSDIRVMEQMLRRDSGGMFGDFDMGAAGQQEQIE